MKDHNISMQRLGADCDEVNYGHLSVRFGGVEEDGAVVLADFLALFDVLDRLNDDSVLHVVPVETFEAISKLILCISSSE